MNGYNSFTLQLENMQLQQLTVAGRRGRVSRNHLVGWTGCPSIILLSDNIVHQRLIDVLVS
jgi:hypothetical protein